MAGQSDDIERNASVATRSKSIVSLGAFEGMDEYTALQKYILLYRDPKSAGQAMQDAGDAGKGKSWWQFWRSGSAPNAQPGQDPGAIPPEVCKHLTTIRPVADDATM
jgi:H+-transporting ATPase